MNNMTIIEVNGVKLEVDLRTAKRIDQFRVGDMVKVLVRNYGESFSSYIGVIAGFDAFKERPTIIVAYLETDYSKSNLKFVYITKDTKDIEICAAHDFDLNLERSDIVSKMDGEIRKKEDEIQDLKAKKKYFLDQFSKAFNFPVT